MMSVTFNGNVFSYLRDGGTQPNIGPRGPSTSYGLGKRIIYLRLI